jgi:anti-sigma B factor antagonist
MHLTLESQLISGVAVIRCRGRIVVGNELSLLQQEVEKHRLETPKYVLDLGEVTYLDSGGLGALVRLMGILRAHRGDLKLCRVSSFVHDVLKATNLLSVFTVFPTERDGLVSFAQRPAPREGPASPRIPQFCASTRPAICSLTSRLSSSVPDSRSGLPATSPMLPLFLAS